MKPNKIRMFRVQLTPEQQALEDFKDAIATRLQTMVCPICNAWIEGGGLHHPGCKLRKVEDGLDTRPVEGIGGLNYKGGAKGGK